MNNIVKTNDIAKIDMNYYKDLSIKYSIKLSFGILIIIIFYFLAKFVNHQFKNIIKEDSLNDSNMKKKMILYKFIGNGLYYIILLIGIIIFLLILGIQLNTVLVLFGSIGFALALAIQGTIKEIVSGLMILIFNYYNVGDYIEINGHQMFVYKFNLFNTTFIDIFTAKTIVPNSTITNGILKVITSNKTVYTDIPINISANNNINYTSLINTMKSEILEKSEYILNNDINIVIVDMSTFGTLVKVKALINSIDYLQAKFSINLIIRDLLNKHSILLLDESYLSFQTS